MTNHEFPVSSINQIEVVAEEVEYRTLPLLTEPVLIEMELMNLISHEALLDLPLLPRSTMLISLLLPMA
ncbi:MAG: hypothetical protein WCJ45_01805 [bacterium]